MKLNKYITILISILVLSSCDSFLDIVPDNVATIDNAFVDAYETESYLFTCYRYMPNTASWNDNPALLGTFQFWLYPNETFMQTKMGSIRGHKLAQGYQSKNNPYFNYWGGSEGGTDLYEGIRHCNVLIQRVPAVKDMDEIEKKRYIAEANFLKAYYHFYLIRMYGPIPIMDENLDVSLGESSSKVYRENVETCLNYVVKTLDKAIVDLPETIMEQGMELGRATQVMAKALKAKVLVTAASPFFNGNDLSLKDNNSVELLKTTFDQTKWEKAKDACKEAIDLAEAVGHELYYYQDSRDINDTTRNRMNIRVATIDEWNSELLWGNSRAGAMYNHQIQLPPKWMSQSGWHQKMRQTISPTINSAEMFYSANGVPIENDKDYDYNARYELTTVDKFHKWHMKEGTTQPKLHMNRETRFYADLAFDRSIWYGNERMNDKDPRYLYMKGGELSNGGVLLTGYLLKKNVFYKNSYAADNRATMPVVPFPEFRLADLYLLYAEALNETIDAPNDEVHKYINLVRKRAALPTVKKSWDNHSKTPEQYKSQSGMRKIIRKERMIELFGEGQTYWDLKRWYIAHDYMNTSIKAWSCDEKSTQDYYKLRTVYNQEFQQKDYLWPINESYIINNPNLVQNYGW